MHWAVPFPVLFSKNEIRTENSNLVFRSYFNERDLGSNFRIYVPVLTITDEIRTDNLYLVSCSYSNLSKRKIDFIFCVSFCLALQTSEFLSLSTVNHPLFMGQK